MKGDLLMNNELVLYTVSNGISLDVNISTVPEMMKYNKILKTQDVDKIVKAVNLGLYDMAAEYIWSRTINILKKDILQFGSDFVCEMLDRPSGDVDSISEYEIITLSADLGFINKTAKMEFLQYSETIQHYMSNEDPSEEYPATKLVDMVRSCVKHVLGYEKVEYEVSFVSFREKLKLEIINSKHQLYTQVVESPYFYKKTITKTLLNLAKTLPDSAERENVFANIGYLIFAVWNTLSSDDKWSVGRSYAQANNDGDSNLSKALKSLLVKVKGFDYVPENLRSNSFIKVAKDLLSAHFGINNFYNEPSFAKLLSTMGSSIPAPAFGVCMTSILACKLGNYYGVSWDAQLYLDSLLEKVTPERWKYYCDTVLIKDETILYKLTQEEMFNRFIPIANEYELCELDFENSNIRKFMQNIKEKNYKNAKKICKELYDGLTSV